ncbi:MAG TPA: STAS domain-containing protein [Bacilli bacterium]|nr:STAS domain-containing protein [Bacilli bacterium]
MLNIDMRFEKGILIVDLDGELTEKNSIKIKKHLTNLIKDNGVKYVLINFDNISKIDSYGISSIIENYKVISDNRGKLILCGIMHILRNNANVYENIYQINEESEVFDLVEV